MTLPGACVLPPKSNVPPPVAVTLMPLGSGRGTELQRPPPFFVRAPAPVASIEELSVRVWPASTTTVEAEFPSVRTLFVAKLPVASSVALFRLMPPGEVVLPRLALPVACKVPGPLMVVRPL